MLCGEAAAFDMASNEHAMNLKANIQGLKALVFKCLNHKLQTNELA